KPAQELLSIHLHAWIYKERRPVLRSWFWVLGSGFWVLGSGFWVLGSGFWVLGSSFWFWVCWVSVFLSGGCSRPRKPEPERRTQNAEPRTRTRSAKLNTRRP